MKVRWKLSQKNTYIWNRIVAVAIIVILKIKKTHPVIYIVIAPDSFKLDYTISKDYDSDYDYKVIM